MQTRAMQNQSRLFSPISKPNIRVIRYREDIQRIVKNENKEIKTRESELQKYQTGLDRLGIQNQRGVIYSIT